MSKGLSISVTAETNAGGRRHMEDYLAVKLCPNDKLRQVPHLREQAFIGVFDGHGGKEAAKFARERLWDVIQDQPKYQSNDMESVCESLSEAYEALHREMEPLRGKCACIQGRGLKRVMIAKYMGGAVKWFNSLRRCLQTTANYSGLQRQLAERQAHAQRRESILAT